MTDPHAAPQLLLVLVAVIVATKLLGEVAQRLGQPAVLGELAAGVLLGASVFGLLDPAESVVAALAEIGVLVLLFEIGMHTDVRSLARVGGAATVVAVVGVALPFSLGYAAARMLGVGTISAVVCGAALTATSIGISARVLSDLGQLDTPEGQVVLGAAVIDDVLGLIILSVVSGLVAGADLSLVSVGKTTLLATGFIAVALAVGRFLVPTVLRLVERLRSAGVLGLAALALAFLLAWLAALSGSAPIIGAFSAGLLLHGTRQRAAVERATTAIGHFFVPIFFAAVGAAVDLRSLADWRVLSIGGVLFAVGVVGKFAAGFAPWWFRGNKPLIGVAMVPRGEVGLIFAQMGLATGALDVRLFSAVTMVVMASTFLVPPLVARLAAAPAAPSPGGQPGDGGIDDLVAGAATRSAFPDDGEAVPEAASGAPTAPRAGVDAPGEGMAR